MLLTTITLERLAKRGYCSMLDYYFKVAPLPIVIGINEPLPAVTKAIARAGRAVCENQGRALRKCPVDIFSEGARLQGGHSGLPSLCCGR